MLNSCALVQRASRSTSARAATGVKESLHHLFHHYAPLLGRAFHARHHRGEAPEIIPSARFRRLPRTNRFCESLEERRLRFGLQLGNFDRFGRTVLSPHLAAID